MIPIPFAERGAWRRYTTADGLAANQTEHIVEDGDGYLWIATVTGGVRRFDGDVFRTYTTRDGLPSNEIHSLCVDRGGRLWCGTYAGLCWLDGDGFRRFEGDGTVASQRIMFLYEDSRGLLWIGGSGAGQSVCGYWDGDGYVDLAPRFEAVAGEQEPRAEGWIAGEYVPLLERAGEDAWREGGCWVLDPEGVESIDDAGIALLQRWAGREVVLRGASPYLRLVLTQHRLSCEEEQIHGD